MVDDEKAILDMTSRILRNFGYYTFKASCGEEALGIFQRRYREIDLVITDMMMPGISGAETIEKMSEIDPSARFIAVSGIRANEEILRTGASGVKGFVQKPYSAATLLETIEAVLTEDSE